MGNGPEMPRAGSTFAVPDMNGGRLERHAWRWVMTHPEFTAAHRIAHV